MRFRAEQRLRRQHDFRLAREQGRKIDCGAFTAWFYERPSPPASSIAGPPAFPVPATAERHLGVAASQGEQAAGRRFYPVERRLGVVASKAAVGIAVQRNRAKRRLREVFRQHQQAVPAGYDVVLVARRSLNRLEYGEIEKRFVDACRRLTPTAV